MSSRTDTRGYIYEESGGNPWIVRIPLLTISGILLFLFVMMIALAGYQYNYQERIYPGVSTVYGVNLTGLTREEAHTALQQSFTYDEQASFVFHYGDQTWEYTAT